MMTKLLNTAITAALEAGKAILVIYKSGEFDVEIKEKGVNETATVVKCNNPKFQLEIGKEVLSIDPAYFRPTEVDLLIGDPTKATEKLGWVPEDDLASLVKDMMQSDVKLMQKQQYLKAGGYHSSKNLE
tara:strand:- start:3475 stop:3861 length:387 start_codon:yes stop_codon:yes gene_type:complete